VVGASNTQRAEVGRNVTVVASGILRGVEVGVGVGIEGWTRVEVRIVGLISGRIMLNTSERRRKRAEKL
jgi:hypothetical protein